MKFGTMRRRVGASLLAILTGLTVAASLVQAPPAQAANVTDGFDAGNIISDENFYNGRVMEPNQVQSFLNQRVTRCTIGDPGRAAGSAWGSTKIANNCLRDFRMTTQSRPANAYCKAYGGSANEPAANIITKVGQACGISQRVLLIMLEKEQSLVTDTWPTVRQFDVAMGYACPDSGPGGSANCDPSQTGFFQQVYRAAWQLKVYRAHPNSYNYKPFQNNRIQWHPNVGCGTSNVYIQNWATAALYIYTPYRPNQAALNAGWGTGDSCSSYGNRNFYNFYKQWFGNPRVPSYAVHTKFANYWGAQRSWLGEPSAAAKTLSTNGGGLIQSFKGGGVYLSNAKGAQIAGISAGSPIMTAFIQAGALEGAWGWPLAPGANMGGSGNNTMRFTSGVVVEAVGSGVYLIPNTLVPDWNNAGGFHGSWGVPTRDATASGGFTQQQFKNVLVVRDAQGTVHAVPNEFAAAWTALGGYKGSLGVPVGEPLSIAGNGGGKRLDFTGGAIFSSRFGAFGVGKSEVVAMYDEAGGPTGEWGWPKAPQKCDALGKCTMDFEFGVATWSADGAPNFIAGGAGTGTAAQVGRLAGANRYATAVSASQHAYGSTASTVVIASGGNYPDALSAGALAAHLDAPLLLTAQAALPDVTRAEIQRLRPSRIIVAGGPGVVGDAVLADLKTHSSEVVRLAGANRYSTSRAIVEYGWEGASDVFIASGEGYPDALSAGAAAGSMDAPVLLVRGQGTLDTESRTLLTGLGTKKAHLVGGPGVLSVDIEVGLNGGGVSSIARYGGQNRYETSARVADAVFQGRHDVYWAVGTDFADALAGAPIAGSAGSPLMLTRPTCVPPQVEAATARLQPGNIVLLGGEGVLSPQVAARRGC